MVDYNNYVPIQAINNYIWKLLQEKRGWSAADYDGKMPIIPGARQPEFANYSSPYICYGYSEESGGYDWYNVAATAAYTIYGSNDQAVNNTVRFLSDALRRSDDSASDVNRWVHANIGTSIAFQDLAFHFIRVINTQGPGAEASEGGAVEGLVVIRFQYAVDYPADAFLV